MVEGYLGAHGEARGRRRRGPRRRGDLQRLRTKPPEGRSHRGPGGDDRSDARTRRAIFVLAAALRARFDDGEPAGVRGGHEARLHGTPQARRGPNLSARAGPPGPRVPREGRAIREGRPLDRFAGLNLAPRGPARATSRGTRDRTRLARRVAPARLLPQARARAPR